MKQRRILPVPLLALGVMARISFLRGASTRSPCSGVASGRPHVVIEEVVTSDPRTVLIRWKNPCPQADELGTNSKYPFDPRRTEQLMTEAGYRKGPAGFYLSKSGEKMTFEIKAIASAQNSAKRAIMGDGWRRLGFDFEENDFTPAQAQQGESLGQFRSLSTTSGGQGESSIASFQTAAISNPSNGWRGGNRGAWSNAEYDRLGDALNTTLDRKQRDGIVLQALKIWTEQLAAIPLYFNPPAMAYPSSLKGINVLSPTTEMSWNVHEWELL